MPFVLFSRTLQVMIATTCCTYTYLYNRWQNIVKPFFLQMNTQKDIRCNLGILISGCVRLREPGPTCTIHLEMSIKSPNENPGHVPPSKWTEMRVLLAIKTFWHFLLILWSIWIYCSAKWGNKSSGYPARSWLNPLQYSHWGRVSILATLLVKPVWGWRYHQYLLFPASPREILHTLHNGYTSNKMACNICHNNLLYTCSNPEEACGVLKYANRKIYAHGRTYR